MRVIVTGAGGFLGRRLVRQLLDQSTLATPDGRPEPIERLVACDLALAGLPADPRLEPVEADASDPAVIRSLVTADTAAVFHLAAVVSVAAEQDFDDGMRVNLDATRSLLEACRRVAPGCRFLFASSVAVYGGDLPAVVTDETAPAPQTSYGTQKAVGELLINDYSRRGFVDGRCLRLPTIVVRPGRPNLAASAFASSIIREPLEGREVACPVPPQTPVCVLSPRRVVESFLRAAAAPAGLWGPTRVCQLPGLTLSVQEMLAALARVAGEAVARRVRFEPDPVIRRIVGGWPTRFRSAKAERLGFAADGSMEEIIRAFMEDEMGPPASVPSLGSPGQG
jgi:nucleoside-diphosphate-sugar epimerase